jgi:hypothetical protein
MTKPRYSVRNTAEIVMILSSAAAALAGADGKTSPRITPVTRPATSDAAAYLQTAAITNETPNLIGRPAYQNPGIKRTQYDILHAPAIPSGPHGSSATNKKTVTVSSTTLQRNNRPGFPTER